MENEPGNAQIVLSRSLNKKRKKEHLMQGKHFVLHTSHAIRMMCSGSLGSNPSTSFPHDARPKEMSTRYSISTAHSPAMYTWTSTSTNRKERKTRKNASGKDPYGGSHTPSWLPVVPKTPISFVTKFGLREAHAHIPLDFAAAKIRNSRQFHRCHTTFRILSC